MCLSGDLGVWVSVSMSLAGVCAYQGISIRVFGGVDGCVHEPGCMCLSGDLGVHVVGRVHEPGVCAYLGVWVGVSMSLVHVPIRGFGGVVLGGCVHEPGAYQGIWVCP